MLYFENAKRELKKWNFNYKNNVLPGHSTYKVKWVLPVAPVTVIAPEKETSYLFGFEEKVSTFFLLMELYYFRLFFIKVERIKKFEVKKGLLLENSMIIVTNEMNVSLKMNKTVVGNSWVKENVNYLEEFDYYKR